MLIRSLKPLFFNSEGRLHWQNLLRIAVIVGILLLSTQIYHIAPRFSWKYWLALAGAAFFAVLALKNMTAALTLVLLTSATSGVVIGTGRATPLPVGLLLIVALTGIWVLKMMLTERRIHIKPSPANLPLLLFLIAAIVSWIVGYAIWDLRIPQTGNKLLVQGGQYTLYLLSFAAMYLVAHQNLSERDLKLWTIIISVIGLTSILAELFLGIYKGREIGITGALYVFPVTLIAAQALFNPQLRNWLRSLILAILLFWLIWAFRNQQWKGGWLPAFFGMVILFSFRSWKLFVVGAILVTVVIVLNWGSLVQVFFDPEVDSTSTIRPLVWLDILRMVAPRSPILGLGLANYMYYWSDPTFTPASRVAAGWATWNSWGYAIPSHNMFMDIFAQMGLVGLSFFIWGIVALFRMIYQVIKSLPPGFTKAYVLGVFAGFGAMLVGSFFFADWLIPFVYNITITGFRHSVYAWILVGSVLGLYYQQQRAKVGTNA
jgi:hypothetical protein